MDSSRPTSSATMQVLSGLLLFACLTGPAFARKSVPATPSSDSTKFTFFDYENPSPLLPQYNPYNVLASMNSWTAPILDHTGKPHEHGHVVQVIRDGGNGIQDPPRADGWPGGDDSLAYGNFNLILLDGLKAEGEGNRTGMFFSQRYFIPFDPPPKAYYLRVWEGSDFTTAPYYQDAIEYDTGDDRGGGMITLHDGPPVDVDWRFGPSKARPKPDAEPKK
jgi:hypothetical protein